MPASVCSKYSSFLLQTINMHGRLTSDSTIYCSRLFLWVGDHSSVPCLSPASKWNVLMCMDSKPSTPKKIKPPEEYAQSKKSDILKSSYITDSVWLTYMSINLLGYTLPVDEVSGIILHWKWEPASAVVAFMGQQAFIASVDSLKVWDQAKCAHLKPVSCRFYSNGRK